MIIRVITIDWLDPGRLITYNDTALDINTASVNVPVAHIDNIVGLCCVQGVVAFVMKTFVTTTTTLIILVRFFSYELRLQRHRRRRRRRTARM